jgi:hypothetical protein
MTTLPPRPKMSLLIEGQYNRRKDVTTSRKLYLQIDEQINDKEFSVK